MVAQRPPPTHGQAVANATLMDADYDGLRVHPVEMGFSKELDDVSRFRPGKLIELLRVAFEIGRLRTKGHRDVLFYSVGLRNRTGLYRDMILLLLTRPFFRRTALHVHTGGTGSLIEGLPGPLRPLAERAYGGADTVIYLDPFLLEGDTGMPTPVRHVFVPYGVEPQRVGTTPAVRASDRDPVRRKPLREQRHARDGRGGRQAALSGPLFPADDGRWPA